MRTRRSDNRNAHVWRVLVVLACIVVTGFVTSACQSNAEKIEAFCTDMKSAVEENQKDCDAMATALDEVLDKHEGVKTFGTAEGEEVQAAVAGCEEGARIIAAKCANHAAVTEVLQRLEND